MLERVVETVGKRKAPYEWTLTENKFNGVTEQARRRKDHFSGGSVRRQRQEVLDQG